MDNLYTYAKNLLTRHYHEYSRMANTTTNSLYRMKFFAKAAAYSHAVEIINAAMCGDAETLQKIEKTI